MVGKGMKWMLPVTALLVLLGVGYFFLQDKQEEFSSKDSVEERRGVAAGVEQEAGGTTSPDTDTANNVEALATEEMYEIAVGEQTFMVSLAADKQSRTKGLSGVRSLAPRTGKLFVFEKPDLYGFWMPDMYISLDMLWFSDTGELVYLAKNVPPESYPAIYKPDRPALYVLEINAGESETLGIEVGDRLTLSDALQRCLKESCYTQ